jgi:single-strand DNA-binding protein
MPYVNRVIFMGNLTRDPQLRQTPSETAVCQFALAMNRGYNDAEGQRQQETTFVDVEAWGRRGELISQYLHKGDPLLVEGRMRLDQWQDSEGQSRSRLKAVVESFQFVGSRSSGQGTNEAKQPEPRDGGSKRPAGGGAPRNAAAGR